jgi:glycosyltransferase involved in cell wall biosynthesis
MRIAQIAPLIERVPPKKYGGTERVVHALTQELVRRGHDVTLFASGDSLTSAKLFSVTPKSLREAKAKDMYGNNMFSLLNIGIAYQMQDQFDIIHDHTGFISLPTANQAHKPVVMTLHGALSTTNRRIYEVFNKLNYVAISKSQMRPAPNLHYAGTVYNGLNLSHYPEASEPEDYLLYVGRICLEKGTHYAIEAAQNLNKKLIIAAKLEPTDQKYFQEQVEPLLSDQIQWIGEVSEDQRNQLMNKALCLLHPVTWREPFGLTMIEAMACGAPVVAFNRGSIPEIIQNGENGFVVEDVDEMLEAINNLDRIDRQKCRAHVLEKFSAEKMADGYESIYTKILGSGASHDQGTGN